MKPSLWKRLLSYVKDVHIESTSSPYNDSLDLYLVKGSFQLCTEKAVYSFAEKYDNFFDTFKNIRIDNHKDLDVLLLGLGMGSIPYMLEKSFNCNFHYTAVEIDSEVIYLASKYVFDELESDIEVIEADAFHYMSQEETKYDLICMDIFTNDVIPEVFESVEFLEMLKSCLADDGILLYNRLNVSTTDKQLSNDFLNSKVKSVFPNAQGLTLTSNLMIINEGKYLNQNH